MQYNAQGQLSRIEGTPNIANIGRASYKTYEYDGSGNLTTTKLYYLSQSNQTYELYETRTLTYNSDKLPVTNTVFIVPGASTSTYNYAYTNGNQTQTTINSPGQPTTTYSEQFDNTPNPLYGLIGMPEGYNVSVVNRNNSIGPNRKATYGSNGLISDLVIGTNLDAAQSRFLTFTYETY
ncbi:hypothetical protein [Spirosoma oryzae]|nr:hypothetical protein [Spirosoma oryzae]